uniref:ABC transmembrane type-1 domain-containing protein n=1 Tax=Acyrthosiphon pisum TaxID=7029 RepID=A0A8R2D7V9_ACYPI|eukprot:XP_016664499.1 PREDICTED: histidine ammonia-lyase-like [Acyrthosiphon pisum]
MMSLLSFGADGWGRLILGAAFTTLLLSLAALMIGAVVGSGVAAAKLSPQRWVRWLGEAYSTVFRGIPELLVIYLFYFGGSGLITLVGQMFGADGFIEAPPFLIGALAIGLISGSYQGEVYRAARLALAKGEVEAAVAIGMPRWRIAQRILLPQIVRYALPGMSNVWQMSLKDSALVSVTGIVELMRASQLVAFDAEVIALKASPGMQVSGLRLRQLLSDSPLLAKSVGVRTQDALSLRSMPQVHGASRDQFDHAARQVNTELNACTDNPLVLGTVDNWRVVSQANPHGESVAMAADLLAIAMAEVGSIAERRLDRLVNPLVSGLPAFLVAQPGVNSGMMIAQYVAASLCAENRQLAQPAVLDNYVTSGLQEDHLSLGTGAALKLLKLVGNVWQILAIEYLLAAQALDFHGEAELAEGTKQALRRLRAEVANWQEDRWLAPEIARAVEVMKNGVC